MKTNKPQPTKRLIKPKAEKKDACKCSSNCECCEERQRADKSAHVKRAVITTLLTLVLTNALAQQPDASFFWSDPFNSPMLPLFLTLGLMGITILLLILVIVYVARVMGLMVRQAEAERAEKLGIPIKPSVSWWEKLWQRANATVPIESERDIDTGHEYDGIRELDNHLPPWWKGLFYATIVWGLLYLVVYHVTNSFPLSTDEYQIELAQADQKARELRASKPAEVIDANSLVYIADAEILLRGKSVFSSNNCMSCHRADGGGNTIGPNLTDEYWIHGGSVKEVYSTVNLGAVEKGMPAWGKVMSARDVRDVTFYIMSLRDSNPPGAKAPQGELYKPEQAHAPSDSLTSQPIIK